MIKPKYLALILSTAVLSFAFAGCKSTPTDDGTGEDPAGPETMVDLTESNAAKMAEVDAAREAAVASGAEAAAPNAFKAAEAEYLAVKAASEDSTVDITEAADDLSLRYAGLAAYANALAKKNFIDENKYEYYDTDDYNSAAQTLEELEKTVLVLGADFSEKAIDADTKFTRVIATAYKSIAKNERAAALEAKKSADSVKASVSRKDDYAAAVALLNKGDASFATGAAEEAINSYVAAKESFTTLCAEVTKAREQALAAIEAAKKRTQNSETLAVEADEKVPLEDGAAGIEEEDAILLEEDDFSASEDSEIEVDENVADVSVDDIAETIEVTSTSDAEVKSDEEVVEEIVEDVLDGVFVINNGEVPEK